MTINFDNVTTFIGPNGTGKSTVFSALDWYFNGKPGSLSETDCSFGAIHEDIEVQVSFHDLTVKAVRRSASMLLPELTPSPIGSCVLSAA